MRKLVFVAHPISFDHAFIQWYLHEFVGESPFWPAGLDITSYTMAMLDHPFIRSHAPYMPREWFDPSLPHTHKALDDAMEHAMLLCNMVAANRAAHLATG